MILCCGEALIDFIPASDNQTYRPCPGGSILNIAVGLGRMNVPVGFLSRLSTDLFGDILQRHLHQNKVDLLLSPRVNGQTTLAFVSIDDSFSPEPQYAFYAQGAVDRMMTLNDLPEKLSDDVVALHFGSISLVLEPGASTLEAIMQREKSQRIITLDPNVRPIVINDWPAYRARFKGWLSCVDILRMSDADLQHIYPEDTIETLLPNWFNLGVSLVVLTRGADGAVGFLPTGQIISVASEKILIRDTVGAGDTFFAALLAYLYEKNYLSSQSSLARLSTDDLHACLVFASKAAAINCTRNGADPPYRHEMD